RVGGPWFGGTAGFDDGGGQVRAVEHRGVGAEPGERGHEVGGVADQGDAGPGGPPGRDRPGVDGADDELVVTLLQQAAQRGRPALEPGQQEGADGGGVGQVDATALGPVEVVAQGDVGADA